MILYDTAQVVEMVDDLSHERLTVWTHARLVQPVDSSAGPRWREVDVARLRLLCDLAQDYRLDDEGLALVLSLVDQLHEARAEMRAVLRAIAAEPVETRARLRRLISG